jgi:hypothetical protein
MSVRFVPGNRPHLAVRADYRLANIGNAPLHFIPLTLPAEKDFGLANLGAKIDGNAVAPEHPSGEAPTDWRIPLAASWQRKQKINLTLSYDLASETPTDSRIFVAANTFYLNDSGWFPALRGFKALLSPGVTRPNPSDLRVQVPADFRVTASGRLRATKKQNGETEYRFRIHQADFDPYVLAGQYNEQRASSANTVFWSEQTLANWQPPGDAVARISELYAHLFGPLPRNNATIYVLHAADNIALSDSAKSSDPPPTVVFTTESLGSPQFAAAFPSFADKKSLAGTWFFHVVTPRPQARLLADGLRSYAAELADQQQANRVSRTAEISSALANFDRAAEEAVEKPVRSLIPADPIAVRRIAQSKIILFLFALEDQCGAENVRRSIFDMVYALRGQEYGYSDFRAALEQRSHRNLANFFRTWLSQPGIPPDFRARYENAGANKQ